MYKNKKILALIPARGGSKGVPRKNIKPFVGKPLIAWAIENARKSKYVDRVIVSTDDRQIAKIARMYMAETPFVRPARLATSYARGIDVILHAVRWLEEHDQAYDLIMLLQPTSPLRVSDDIDDAIALLFRKNANAIISVCETEHSPLWSNTLPENGCMQSFLRPSIMHTRRQKLPRFYRLNGAIFLVDAGYLKKYENFFGKKSYAYIMSQERSVDIDTQIDFEFAEYLYKARRKRV